MRAIAIAAIATLAVPAFAQEEGGEGADTVEETPSEPTEDFGGGDTVAPAPTKPEGGEPVTSAPETYTVRPGDTLWTLSQRFLNNPWYWPRIWSYNQELDNPNWIYPGRQIRFYPGSDAPVVQQPEPDDEPDFEDVAGGGFEGEGIGDRFADMGNTRRRREFFVPNEQLNDAGQVLNSPEEKRLLTVADRSYIKLKKQNKPGDVLQIFRPSREIRHPVTGASLGRIVEMLGEVRVDLLSREQALGTIMASWDTIERGDYVAELPIDTEAARAVENEKNVKGYVVDTGKVVLNYLGENYIVIMDKGENDGVKVGNTFIVVRAGDPYTKEYSGMADEDIGEILIVEVNKTVSTGVLINATREIVPGDRAEMRVPK
jgi:hypothetical protein